MKRSLLALLLGLGTLYAGAQITFVKGYIVNDKGDTIRGEVKYNPKKEQDCYNKVFFKDEAGLQKNYKPNKKVKGYGFNGQNFVAMDFEGEMKFYKALAQGDLNFYQMKYEVIYMNQPTLGGSYYIARKGDEKHITEIKEGKFKKQMADWMKDNPDFLNDYEEGKEFNAESAAAVIGKYNAWKAEHGGEKQ